MSYRTLKNLKIHIFNLLSTLLLFLLYTRIVFNYESLISEHTINVHNTHLMV